jgi:hypothetical protein
VGGQIPCADDSSCPADYPVCSAGKCNAGVSTKAATIAIVGVEGHSPSDFVRQTVRVDVTARANSGVQSVSLAGGGKTYTPVAASTPPLYFFDVDTTQLTDGDTTFTATVTPGSGAAVTATVTLHIDNTPPTITAPSGNGAPVLSQTVASAGSVLTIDFKTSEPSTIVATAVSGAQTYPMAEVNSGTAGVRRVAISTGSSMPMGVYTVTISATDSAGNTSSVSDSIATPLKYTVVAPPAVNSFSGPVSVGTSGSVLITYDLSGGTGVITGTAGTGIPISNITAPGSSTVTAPSVLVNTPVSYTLTVTNAAGAAVNASISVLVLPAPSATLVFTDSGGTANNGTAISTDPHTTIYLKPTFSGGAATLNGLNVTSGVTVPVANVVQTTTYSLVVTNPAGTTFTTTATATVNAVVRSFTVNPLFATVNTSTTFTFTASHEGGGASGTASGTITSASFTGGLSIASGAGQQAQVTSSLTGDATYTLTVNNSAGTAESPLATAGVTVVAPPVATSLLTGNSTNAITITGGNSTGLTPTFTNDSGGTAIIQAGTVTVASGLTTGMTINVGPTATTTYTLVVTNRAGMVDNAQTATVTVASPPVQPSITSSMTVTTGTSNTASVTARTGFTYLWTISSGTFGTGGSSGVTSSGTNTMTYTAGPVGNTVITCQEVNAALTKSGKAIANVTVVAPPAQPTISTIVNGLPATQVFANSNLNPASVTANPNMTYSWTVTGTGASLTGGQGTANITYAAGSGTVGLSVVEVNQASTPSIAGTKSMTIASSGVNTPSITVASNVTAGTSNTASVVNRAGESYAWSISNNGKITAGGTSNSATFTAGVAGTNITLNVTATQNSTGQQALATPATIGVAAVPSTPAIALSASNVTTGQPGLTAQVTANTGMTYAWTVTNASITNGCSGTPPCTSGPGLTATGHNTITYTAGTAGTPVIITCQEVNAANLASAANSVSQVVFADVSPPTINTAANVGAGNPLNTASIATPRAGMTYNWQVNGGASLITSGQGTSSILYTAPTAATTSFTVTATEQNVAGKISNPGSATVSNLTSPTAPSIASLSPASGPVGNKETGHTAGVTSTTTGLTFTWAISGGDISGGQGTPTVTYTVTAPQGGQVSITATAVNAANQTSGPSTALNISVASGSYLTVTDLAVARVGATATQLNDGRILITGGAPTPTGTPTATAVICNSIGQACAATSNSMAIGRMNHTATLLASGKVLIAGGYTAAGPATPTLLADILDPAANGTFSPVNGSGGGSGCQGKMTASRAAHVAVRLNDSLNLVLVAGGTANGSTALASAEVFDPASTGNTCAFFALVNSMAEARMNFAGALLNTTSPSTALLIGSGTDGLGEVFSDQSQNTTFNVAANATFTATSGLSTVTTNLTATLFNSGNSVLIVGGHSGTAPTSTSYLYTVAGGGMAFAGSMSTARELHTATLLANNKVLIAGGTVNGGGATASSELYNATGTTAAVTGSMSTARSQHAASIIAGGEVLMVGGISGTSGSMEIYVP